MAYQTNTTWEIDDNEICPCGTKRKYRNCCKRKKLQWVRKDGQLSRSIEMGNEDIEIIKELEVTFKEMYGRELSEADFLFSGLYNNKKNFDFAAVKAMRKAKVPEEYIYAYCQTGLILTEENVEKVPNGFIEEFSRYVEEYQKLVYEEPSPSGEINILCFVRFSNQFLRDHYDKLINYLTHAYNYYIRMHIEESQDFMNYNVITAIDYGGLCAVKTLKNIESIEKLLENGLEENIYATSRSIFESYLYMTMINKDDKFFTNKVLKNSKVSIIELAKNSSYKQDELLYEVFFRESSRFVHLDILSAQSYFKDSHPFEEVDGALVASLTGLTFALLSIEQIAMFRECDQQFREDVIYMTKNAKKDLIKCYNILCWDSSPYKEMIFAMINRLNA